MNRSISRLWPIRKPDVSHRKSRSVETIFSPRAFTTFPSLDDHGNSEKRHPLFLSRIFFLRRSGRGPRRIQGLLEGRSGEMQVQSSSAAPHLSLSLSLLFNAGYDTIRFSCSLSLSLSHRQRRRTTYRDIDKYKQAPCVWAGAVHYGPKVSKIDGLSPRLFNDTLNRKTDAVVIQSGVCFPRQRDVPPFFKV